MKNLPRHIVKKNRYMYKNTLNGEYIHKDKIVAYIDYKYPSEEQLEAKDRQIRNKRFDLNY